MTRKDVKRAVGEMIWRYNRSEDRYEAGPIGGYMCYLVYSGKRRSDGDAYYMVVITRDEEIIYEDDVLYLYADADEVARVELMNLLYTPTLPPKCQIRYVQLQARTLEGVIAKAQQVEVRDWEQVREYHLLMPLMSVRRADHTTSEN